MVSRKSNESRYPDANTLRNYYSTLEGILMQITDFDYEIVVGDFLQIQHD